MLSLLSSMEEGEDDDEDDDLREVFKFCFDLYNAATVTPKAGHYFGNGRVVLQPGYARLHSMAFMEDGDGDEAKNREDEEVFCQGKQKENTCSQARAIFIQAFKHVSGEGGPQLSRNTLVQGMEEGLLSGSSKLNSKVSINLEIMQQNEVEYYPHEDLFLERITKSKLKGILGILQVYQIVAMVGEVSLTEMSLGKEKEKGQQSHEEVLQPGCSKLTPRSRACSTKIKAVDDVLDVGWFFHVQDVHEEDVLGELTGSLMSMVKLKMQVRRTFCPVEKFSMVQCLMEEDNLHGPQVLQLVVINQGVVFMAAKGLSGYQLHGTSGLSPKKENGFENARKRWFCLFPGNNQGKEKPSDNKTMLYPRHRKADILGSPSTDFKEKRMYLLLEVVFHEGLLVHAFHSHVNAPTKAPAPDAWYYRKYLPLHRSHVIMTRQHSLLFVTSPSTAHQGPLVHFSVSMGLHFRPMVPCFQAKDFNLSTDITRTLQRPPVHSYVTLFSEDGSSFHVPNLKTRGNCSHACKQKTTYALGHEMMIHVLLCICPWSLAIRFMIFVRFFWSLQKELFMMKTYAFCLHVIYFVQGLCSLVLNFPNPQPNVFTLFYFFMYLVFYFNGN